MLGKRPRPFLQATSDSQLFVACYGDESGPPAVLGSPHVVIGFDVSAGNPKSHPKALPSPCESPRSVLPPTALSDSSHYQSRFHRSLLGTLLDGADHNLGLGLGVVAVPRAEAVAGGNTICQKSQAIAITEQLIQTGPPNSTCGAMRELTGSSSHVDFFRDVDYGGDDDDDGNWADDDENIEENISCVEKSIFYAASSSSNCYSLCIQAADFLSVCYFCKCRLKPGKDIFMYRGDRAFCSMECRYQHIVVNELKERC